MWKIDTNNSDYVLLTSDWHIRESIPNCREDAEFKQAIFSKLNFITKLQQTYKCPIIHAGDLFDHWKVSPELLSFCFTNLPDQLYSIYGNHDLPQHSIDLRYKSALHTLEAGGKVRIIPSSHWGVPPTYEHYISVGNKTMLIIHTMTYVGNKPFPTCTDPSARILIHNNPVDFILTGHNHKQILVKGKKTTLLNPGSILRTRYDEINATPTIWLWNHKNNELIPIEIPHVRQAVKQPIDAMFNNERNERLDAFVSKLMHNENVSLDYVQNVQFHLQNNEIKPKVKKHILKALSL